MQPGQIFLNSDERFASMNNEWEQTGSLSNKIDEQPAKNASFLPAINSVSAKMPDTTGLYFVGERFVLKNGILYRNDTGSEMKYIKVNVEY